MTKLADRTDIPVLKGGWLNFTEAAELLGWSRSYMYKYAESPGFKTLHRIGGKASYVINESEVEAVQGSRIVPAATEEEPDPVAKAAPRKRKLSKTEAALLEQEFDLETGVEKVKELSLEEVLSKL